MPRLSQERGIQPVAGEKNGSYMITEEKPCLNDHLRKDGRQNSPDKSGISLSKRGAITARSSQRGATTEWSF